MFERELACGANRKSAFSHPVGAQEAEDVPRLRNRQAVQLELEKTKNGKRDPGERTKEGVKRRRTPAAPVRVLPLTELGPYLWVVSVVRFVGSFTTLMDSIGK